MHFSAILVATAVASSAFAQVSIPASSSIGPVPGFAGDGLSGNVWRGSPGSIANALAVINGGPADGSFHSTLIDYPNGASTVVTGGTFGDFLGADAGSLTGTVLASDSPYSLIFRFTGYIAISAGGRYTFGVGSDDGFTLSIGGVEVTNLNGDRGFGFSTGQADFTDAGLYPVDLVYWANGIGQSGVEFVSSIAGGPDYGNSGLAGIVPTGVLYTVIPTPASAGLLMVAAGLSARRRRA